MKNCNILNHEIQQALLPQNIISAFLWDELTDSKYYITNTFQLEIHHSSKTTSLDLTSTLTSDDTILDLEKLIERDSLVIVSRKGEIVSIDLQGNTVSVEGSIENGILHAKWSPNQEKIVIATQKNSLILLDSSFNPIQEVPLDDGEGFNNVDPEINDALIAWRPDSKYFSVTYHTHLGSKCLIREPDLTIFKSSAKSDPDVGLVQSVSEKPLENLKVCTNWISDGSLVTGVEKCKNGEKIIFWEKNGLKHGEFQFSLLKIEQSYQIKQLVWNKTSELLAVYFIDANQQNLIYLCTRSNYHWYVKKVMHAYNNEEIVSVSWSIKNPYKLLIVNKFGIVEYFEFIFDYLPSNGIRATDQKPMQWVAFNDFNTINVTPLSLLNIPPPLFHKNITIEDDIIIDFTANDNFLAILTLKNLFIYKYDFNSITLIEKFCIKELNSDYRVHGLHLKSISLDNFIIAYSYNNKSNNVMRIHKINSTDKTNEIYNINYTTPVSIIFSGCIDELDSFYVHLTNGDIQKITIEPGKQPASESVAHLPERCIKIRSYSIGESVNYLGLTNSHKLYWNSKLISKECTTFETESGYLLFTSFTPGMYDCLQVHKLKEINSLFPFGSEKCILPQPNGKNLSARNTERGSQIVVVSADKLVMQLPRGNLETIHPRLLIIEKVKLLIASAKYYDAFFLLRQNKMDLNIIIDLNPIKFIENLKEFLSQLKSMDNINLFITSLKNDLSEELELSLDCDEKSKILSELYLKCIDHQGKKINMVCDHIRENLDSGMILCLLMTYAKKEPQELEQGLNLIRDIKNLELKGSSPENESHPPHLNPKTLKKIPPPRNVSAKQALEYFCWVAEAEKLYSVALATYDLELATMVAEYTKRDPKEYLPYLELLKRIPNELDRQLKINLDQKLYVPALRVYKKYGVEKFNDSLNLITLHGLYLDGLKIYQDDQDCCQKIENKLAESLWGKKDYKQAAIHYLAAKNTEKSYECFKLTLDWKGAYFLAQSKAETIENIDLMLKEFSELLEKGKYYGKAGQLLLKMTNQKYTKEAVLLILKGNDWKNLKKAVIVGAHDDLIKNLIKPQLNVAVSLKLNEIKDKIKDYISKKQRLNIVQEKKRLLPIIGLGENQEQQFDVMSDASGTTTRSKGGKSTSGISVVTGLSGGARANQRPKNLLSRNVKEGSLFEEDWLVEKMNLYKIEPQWLNDLQHFLDCLIYFGLYQEAGVLMKEVKLMHDTVIRKRTRTIKQEEFEKMNPDLKTIYPTIKEFAEDEPDPFPKFLEKYKYLNI